MSEGIFGVCECFKFSLRFFLFGEGRWVLYGIGYFSELALELVFVKGFLVC